MENYTPIGKLDPSTLVYTVGAVIISLPGMNSEIANIHKALMNDYPFYSEMEIGVLTQDPSNALSNREEKIIQHAMNNHDKSWGILLTEQRILFQTDRYIGFTDFRAKFETVLNTVKQVTGISHHMGLAFRHIDNISPLDKSAELSAAVNSQYMSPDFPNATDKRSRHEYIYTVEDRKLVFRLYNYDPGKGPSIPPDLFANYLGLKSKPTNKLVEEKFVMADFEVTSGGEVAKKFDATEMLNEIDELHKITSIAYRQIVRPEEIKLRRSNDAS